MHDHFSSLVTFGTPHLGITNSSSKLVKTSLQVLSKITKHVALRQMHLADASDIKDTYLMTLSTYEVNCKLILRESIGSIM